MCSSRRHEKLNYWALWAYCYGYEIDLVGKKRRGKGPKRECKSELERCIFVKMICMEGGGNREVTWLGGVGCGTGCLVSRDDLEEPK